MASQVVKISDIVRRHSRIRPHLAEDIAQVAQIALWRASKTTDNPNHMRRAVYNGIVDFLRKEEKTRNQGRLETVPLDDHDHPAPFSEPALVEPSEDLATLMAFVMGAPVVSRYHTKQARNRLQEQL